MKITSIIIDDEPSARKTLRNMLNKYFNNIHVIGEVSNVDDGVRIIKNTHPDVIFLDVRMANKTGFDLLKEFSNRNFHTVFTTAYDQYALKAIKESAIDYLIKPIDIDELGNTIERIENRLKETTEIKEAINTIYNKINNYNSGQILIPTQNSDVVIKLNDILYCEADNNYTKLVLVNKNKILASKTLGYFESILPYNMFVRIHRSYIININRLTSISKGQDGTIVMENGDNVVLSRTKKDILLDLIINRH